LSPVSVRAGRRGIESGPLRVGDLTVEVVRKHIKNVHLRVYPPDGRVRVSAPLALTDEAIRLLVASRLGWIHRKRSALRLRERSSDHRLISGEHHYYRGRRYRLDVIEHAAPPGVTIRDGSILQLRVRPGTDRRQRERTLGQWYRRRLTAAIAGLLEKWQARIGVAVAECRVKKMKTRWGTCNPAARRIWLNLELAKRPEACLEYVLVHEMVHLLERSHNARFDSYMDRFMPQWRAHRDLLSGASSRRR
jgi:predicted metal-dependent hydrolase